MKYYYHVSSIKKLAGTDWAVCFQKLDDYSNSIAELK